jgi:hypothetical protein
MKTLGSIVVKELKNHAPFTLLGTLSGITLMVIIVFAGIPGTVSEWLFWIFHPFHVLLSALATVAMYRLYKPAGIGSAILVGYFGAIGIATLSDCLIPYVGEVLLDLPNRGLHIGFVEKWWLVNPLAAAGIAIGYAWPHTKVAHAGHVLISTWASLLHITMALGGYFSMSTTFFSAIFIFFAVWIPCCTSDIVFPLLFVKQSSLAKIAPKGQPLNTQ